MQYAGDAIEPAPIKFCRRDTHMSNYTMTVSAEETRYKHAILFIMALSYVGLVVLLMASWTQGDDWRGIMLENQPFDLRIERWRGIYLSWVSRFGDFIVFWGQSPSRWESRLIIPLAAVLAPLAFWKLVKIKGETIFSLKGLLFYCFVLCACLVGVYTKSWRNYWCWAAAANYLLPSIAIVYYLSFYRMDNWSIGEKDPQLQNPLRLSVGLFFLGLVSGWGMECASVVLLPTMVALAVYTMRKHRKWSVSLWCGFSGFLLGATLLLASPALAGRAAVARRERPLKVEQLSPSEIHDFLSNLNVEDLNKLRGAGSVVYLGDFSFWEKLHFLPYLIETYWSCCVVGVVCFALLSATILVVRKRCLKVCAVALCIVGISVLMACAYLQSCIPHHMSFLPPCFMVVAACAYLFVRLNNKIAQGIFAALISAYTLYLLVPAGTEAWRYKKYELQRYNEICRQKSEGKTDIVLNYPYPKEPKHSMGLVGGHVASNPKGWPNTHMKDVFQVRSIVQKPKGK